MATYVRSEPSTRAFLSQISRFFHHLQHLFLKNVLIRWRRSPINTSISIVFPLQLILILWLFQYLGFDRLISSNSQSNHLVLNFVPDKEQIASSSSSSSSFANITNAPLRTFSATDLGIIEPTYPVNISWERYGALCDKMCILIIDDNDDDDDDGDIVGKSRYDELERFVHERLVPHLKQGERFRFRVVDVLNSQKAYIDRFMHYCGCVHLRLAQKVKNRIGDMSTTFEIGRDVEVVLQNRTSWANPGNSGSSSAAWGTTAMMSKNQTIHFVERGSTVYLHHVIHSAFLKLADNASNRESRLTLHTQEFPVKRSGDSSMMELISGMILHFIYPTYFFMAMVTTIQPTALITPVVEKEKKIYSNLQMVGCDMFAYHLSWSLVSFIECMASTLLIVILIFAVQLFTYTNITLFALMYILSAASMVPLLQILGLFFSKARTVSLGFSVVSFVMIAIWIAMRAFISVLPSTAPLQYVTYFLAPPVAFLEFIYNVSLTESQIVENGAEAVYLGWGTLTQGSYSLNPSFSLIGIIIMVVVDIAVYTVLLMYLQRVVPQEIGVVDKPWAIFTQRFWRDILFGVTKIMDSENEFSEMFEDIDELQIPTSAIHDRTSSSTTSLMESNDLTSISMDPFTTNGSRQGISIKRLYKTFKHPKKDTMDTSQRNVNRPTRGFGESLRNLFGMGQGRPELIAVDGLTLDIPSGQIFALLGANGAGKSTTLNILTGLLSPNFGSVTINGYNIKDDMEIIRQQMGICMQEDTVYEKMTGYEHMKLYAAIKAIPRRFVKREIQSKLKSVDLWKHRNKLVTSYSGGMKRRLTFALAILGNPQIVVLDEATAGTDPANRRLIWQILQKLRQKPGTTILMTSHSMEEVDLLCDTIAVMKRGKLEVVGTSLQLKQHYGIGYLLACNARDGADPAAVEQRLRRFVHRHFSEMLHHDQPNEHTAVEPQAFVYQPSDDIRADETDRLYRPSGGAHNKIRIVLPYSAVSKFPAFLRDLEDCMDDLQIASYGLSITTLEEVFLRINEDLLVEESQ